jgi:endonuclease/exonuclease/phosphatase family metal-dependent hydrolase
MKYKLSRLSIFFIILMAFSCKKDNTAEDQTPVIEFPIVDTISVMALNVAGLPQGISSGDPVNNTSEIGRRLNDYEIVQVQEDFNYNHLLYGTAKHKYKTSPSGPVPFGDGLNTLSNYKVTNIKRIKWAKCNGTDCLTPKGFSYSQIEIAAGVTVDFYNIHANAGSADPDLEARRQNIAQICAYIDANSVGRPVVVMGDFNCRYTRAGDDIRFFLERGFSDTWIDLIRGGNIPEKDAPALTTCEPSATSPECETVDKIFIRSNDQVKITALSFEKPREAFQRDGKDLSDHIPVSANLRFEITGP